MYIYIYIYETVAMVIVVLLVLLRSLQLSLVYDHYSDYCITIMSTVYLKGIWIGRVIIQVGSAKP